MGTKICQFTITPAIAIRRSGIEEGMEWYEYIAQAGEGEAWHTDVGTVCCCRPTWEDSEHCIWHTDLDSYPIDPLETLEALLETQGLPHERVDGALLNYTSLETGVGRDISFADRKLVAVDFTHSNLKKVDFSGAELRWVNFFNSSLDETNFHGVNFDTVNLSNITRIRDADFADATFLDGVISDVEFEKADFSNARFDGTPFANTTFSHVNLSEAEFISSNMRGTVFSESDVSDAEFRDVDFSNTTFRGTDFTNASFNDVVFSNATLSGEDLSGLDLSNEEFPGAILTETALVGTDLSGRETDLTGANLSDADLTEANFSHADLTNADLSNAKVTGANFRQSTLQDVDFTNANLEGTDLSNSDITGADFTGANLSGTTLAQITGFSEATFESADFSEQRLREFAFTEISSDAQGEVGGENRRTVLCKADFSNADLYGADFGCADLRGAVFVGANCRYADFRHALLKEADFSGADLYQSDCSRANLHQAVFDEANCRYIDFSDSFIEELSLIETDLRNALFDDAKMYRATFTSCTMNASTTIANASLYNDAHNAEGNDLDEGAYKPPCDPPVRPDEHRPATPKSVSQNPADDADRLERKAWVHEEIHRRLIKSGQLREAMSQKHYLDEQDVRTQRVHVLARSAWSEGRYIAAVKSYGGFLNLSLIKWLLILSAFPIYLLGVILLAAIGFALGYSVLGGINSADQLTITAMAQIFAFSLVTIFKGTYFVLDASIGTIIPLEALEPFGALLVRIMGIDDLQPTGRAASLAVIERVFGAMVVIPFTLLIIQRAKLYIGSPLSEEGIGSGFISWFLGR